MSSNPRDIRPVKRWYFIRTDHRLAAYPHTVEGLISLVSTSMVHQHVSTLQGA